MSPLGRKPPVPAVEITRVLPFERERVFRAWIDPRIVAIWFGPRDTRVLDVTLDARVGGEYRFVMGPASWICGTYKEISPPESLIFTWSHVQRLDDGNRRVGERGARGREGQRGKQSQRQDAKETFHEKSSNLGGFGGLCRLHGVGIRGRFEGEH